MIRKADQTQSFDPLQQEAEQVVTALRAALVKVPSETPSPLDEHARHILTEHNRINGITNLDFDSVSPKVLRENFAKLGIFELAIAVCKNGREPTLNRIRESLGNKIELIDVTIARSPTDLAATGLHEPDHDRTGVHVPREANDLSQADFTLTEPQNKFPEINGPYKTIDEIGAGGMGQVYLAQNQTTGRLEAVKFIKADVASAEEKARFEQEVRILARLEHDAIVRLYTTVSDTRGNVGFSMEYVKDGLTFNKLCDLYHLVVGVKSQNISADKQEKILQILNSRLGLTDIKTWPIDRYQQKNLLKVLVDKIKDVASAMSYAHSEGVIHRDLKPGNIMLGAHGGVKVLDLGLGRITNNQEQEVHQGNGFSNGSNYSQHTQLGTILGTASYLAPEQAAGRTDLHSEHSDIYALGAILHFLITGKDQLHGFDLNNSKDPRKALLEAVEQVADSKKSGRIGRYLYRDLEAIRDKAMAKDPSQRYQSMQALVADLNRWQRGEKVEAFTNANSGVKGISYRFMHLVKRHPVVTFTLSASALAIGLIASYVNQASNALGKVKERSGDIAAVIDSNNNDNWAKGRTQIAEDQLALANFKLLPFVRGHLSELQNAKSELEKRQQVHDKYIMPAYSLIAGSSNDLGTYYGTDEVRNAIDQFLDGMMPGYDQESGVNEFIDDLKDKGISQEDEIAVREALSLLLLNLAAKEPWHIHLGFKNGAKGAEDLLKLLKSSTALVDGTELEGQHKMARLFLERRALLELKETHADRLKEVDALLAKLKPVTVHDFYYLGMQHKLNRDYSESIKTFAEAEELAEKERNEAEIEGDLAKEYLFRVMLYGVCIVQGGALADDSQFLLAMREMTKAEITALGVQGEGQFKNELVAMAISRQADVLTQMYKINEQANPELVATVRNFYDKARQLAPNQTTIVINRSRVEYKLKNFSFNVDLISKALQTNSSSIDLHIQYSINQALAGEYEGAKKSIFNLAELIKTKLGRDSDFSDLDYRKLHLFLQENANWCEYLTLYEHKELAKAFATAVTAGRKQHISDNELKLAGDLSIFIMRTAIQRVIDENGYGKNIIQIKIPAYQDVADLGAEYDQELTRLENIRRSLPDTAIYDH